MIPRRMKQKRMIWMQGSVLHPVEKGKTAKYYQNGTWKETEAVVRVLALTCENIKFETARHRYCIEFQRREVGALSTAA